MRRTNKKPRKAIKKKLKKHFATKVAQPAVAKMEDVQKLVQLLQVNQLELEHQNQELRITQEELEASRNKYVNLFDFSPIPYFAVNPDGTIKEVNLSAAKMFGIDRNKLIGRNIGAFIPSEERNIYTTFMKSVFRASAKQSCKLKITNKEKHVFYVLLEGVRLDDTQEAEERCQIALIDLTEYKKLEDSFKEVSEELKSLNTTKDKFTS